MAISDVSLTSGMRSNLLSLQNTVSLLDRTQTRLSTGKKVNTAIDNPVSFFTSKSLTSRASVIDGLKDAMGQAVETIAAADKGITAITSMIEQAKGIVQSALSAEPGEGDANSFNMTFARNFDLGASDNEFDNEYIYFRQTTFKAAATDTPYDGSTIYFTVGAGIEETVENMAEAINQYEHDYSDDAGSFLYDSTYRFTATASGGTLSLTKTARATNTSVPISYNVNPYDLDVGTGGAWYPQASISTSTGPTGGEELTSLTAQYNTLLTQLTELAEDSGYKGKNLLSTTAGLRSMTVSFEGTNLTVTGFDATAAGLGITAANTGTTVWSGAGAAGTTAMNVSSDQLDAALVTLRSESSKLSGNLSIITVRQDFSTDMINTLTEGSDKLTLADSNEEGANMLMLQTRQSLSTTALSLSAQAAQSVLQLFG